MLPDVHYVDLDIRFNPFRPHVFYARDLLGEEPGGLYMGSGMVMLVHVRDGGYLTLYSDNSSSLRRRKGRREGRRKKSQKEKRKVTGGQGRQRVKGKQEKWPEHLFGARL